MCPACISNAALIVAGVASAGGWTSLALRWRRARPQEKERRGDAERGVADP